MHNYYTASRPIEAEILLQNEYFAEHLFLSIIFAGKGRRIAREDEVSDAQLLGINDRELNSMNKHIPGRRQMIWHACKSWIYEAKN